MRSVRVSVGRRKTSPGNSALRTPHSQLFQCVREVVGESHLHRQGGREVVGREIVQEPQIVIHRLSGQQGQVHVAPVLERREERGTGQQPGGGHGRPI